MLKAAVTTLLVLHLAAGSARGQQFVLAPDLIAGVAGDDAGVAFGGYQLAGGITNGTYTGSVAYRWVGFGRSCKTSLPPSCNLDTPRGYALVLEAARLLTGQESVRLRGGLDAGAARLVNNAEDGRNTHFIAGANIKLQVPVGAGFLNVGGVAGWFDQIWFGGGTLGFGFRFR